MDLFSIAVVPVCLAGGALVGCWLVGSRMRRKQHALRLLLDQEQRENIKHATLYEEVTRQLRQRDEDLADLKKQVAVWNQSVIHAKAEHAALSARHEAALKAIEEQKKFVTEANGALRETFSALSSEALKHNNQSFLDLAKVVLEKQMQETKSDLEKRQQAIDAMVKPLSESLVRFDGKIGELEKARQGAHSEIKVFLDSMRITADQLQKETHTLVSALKTTHVRGRYGEIGLRRVVEFAGLSAFCDFNEQPSVSTEEGKLRPDLVVTLPGQRRIIVDAKVPLTAYMQAFETTDEQERKMHMARHAAAVRAHLRNLSAKAYWSQFEDAPDYVIMYLQIESSFGAALELDRTLIEDGMSNRVIFATPTTLITMLRTIAFSWQQVSIAQNIYQIRDAGVELYNRATTLVQHIAAVGSHLNTATQHYNKAVGSLENRFMPQVRKLREIGGTLMNKEIPSIDIVETAVRPVSDLQETENTDIQ